MPLGQKTDDILTFFQVDPCCSFNSKFKNFILKTQLLLNFYCILKPVLINMIVYFLVRHINFYKWT